MSASLYPLGRRGELLKKPQPLRGLCKEKSMGKRFQVMKVGTDGGFVFVKSFDTEMKAWTYLGELEHNLCMEDEGLSYKDASEIIQKVYRIFEPVC